MNRSVMRSSGRKRAGDRLNKCKREQEKGDLSREVATTAANGDIQPGIAQHKENGFKGKCYVCGVQGHSAKYCPKGSGKGKSKGKGTAQTRCAWGEGEGVQGK